MKCSTRVALPLLGMLAFTPLGVLHAQSISLGLMAGGSLSTFTGDLVSDAKNYGGYIVGGYARLSAMGFAVQPGLYYTVKGAKSSSAGTGASDSKTKLDYIQVPVVLRLRLGPLYVGGGPALGFKLGCKVSVSASGYSGGGTDCADAGSGFDAKSTEVTGILEAGIEFGKFSLGARGDLGISNAFEAVQSGSTAKVGVKTQTVSAVAAIRF